MSEPEPSVQAREPADVDALADAVWALDEQERAYLAQRLAWTPDAPFAVLAAQRAAAEPESPTSEREAIAADRTWASGYSAGRVAAARAATEPAPSRGVDVAVLARILRDANIGCEDHHAERDTGDRRQHRVSSHREDAEHIARALSNDQQAGGEGDVTDGLYLAVQMTAKEQDRLRAALELVLSQGPRWDEAEWAAAVTDMLPLLAADPAPEGGERTTEPESVKPAHEHYWVDAPDDETGWHCTICGLTEYPAELPYGAEPR